MQDDIRDIIKEYYEIYFSIGAVYEKLAKIHGLTSSTLFVLYMIYKNQGQCTQRLICEKLFLPKQTVNTILDSFERKGYILRQVADFDKRNKYILLTESGKHYAESVLMDMFHMEETAFANMTTEERQAMLSGERAFLQQLTRSLNLLEKPGSTLTTDSSKNLHN